MFQMVQKIRRRNFGIVLTIIFMMAAIGAVIGYQSINDAEDEYIYLEEPDELAVQVSPTEIEPEPFVSISADKLKSPNAILYSLQDDTILLQKNIDVKIYPASLTKMITAIVAIENLPGLMDEIKMNNAMFEGLFEADASMAGFQPGEIVKGIDLIYGALLPSGAECCIGLAVQIAGSEQGFVEIMNQKAAELGMINTHFENTTGLHDENHYTTVNDLAVFLSYALQNDVFREIFTSSAYSIQQTNKHPDGITFYSTMFEKLKKSNQDVIGGEILGGKTGFTDEAGLCLASLAMVDEQEYILITTGAEGNQYSEQYNITDAFTAYSSISE
jgi:D-alanyl-D-alanine carboxypeptidase (penicillin-binding protein 5/6)